MNRHGVDQRSLRAPCSEGRRNANAADDFGVRAGGLVEFSFPPPSCVSVSCPSGNDRHATILMSHARGSHSTPVKVRPCPVLPFRFSLTRVLHAVHASRVCRVGFSTWLAFCRALRQGLTRAADTPARSLPSTSPPSSSPLPLSLPTAPPPQNLSTSSSRAAKMASRCSETGTSSPPHAWRGSVLISCCKAGRLARDVLGPQRRRLVFPSLYGRSKSRHGRRGFHRVRPSPLLPPTSS